MTFRISITGAFSVFIFTPVIVFVLTLLLVSTPNPLYDYGATDATTTIEYNGQAHEKELNKAIENDRLLRPADLPTTTATAFETAQDTNTPQTVSNPETASTFLPLTAYDNKIVYTTETNSIYSITVDTATPLIDSTYPLVFILGLLINILTIPPHAYIYHRITS